MGLSRQSVRLGTSCSGTMAARSSSVPDRTTCVAVCRGDRNPHIASTPSAHMMRADSSHMVLVCGVLACFVGSLVATYVAITRDPNNKDDRALMKRESIWQELRRWE